MWPALAVRMLKNPLPLVVSSVCACACGFTRDLSSTSGYDEKLVEDPDDNRLNEEFKLFEGASSRPPYLPRTPHAPSPRHVPSRAHSVVCP